MPSPGAEPIPALFTRISTPPNSAFTRAKAAFTEAVSVTSQPMPMCGAPSTAPAAASSRSSTATRAPSSASRLAMAAPIPRAPPVTTARLFSALRICSPSARHVKLGGLAAVNIKANAVHEAGIVRQQEADGPGDLLRAARTVGGNGALNGFLGGGLGFEELLVRGSQHHAGGQRVHAHVVRGGFHGGDAAEVNQRGLGGRISAHAGHG